MSQPRASTTGEREPNRCLARSVVDTLAKEPTLEAVTIDRTHKKISVATLGRADVARLSDHITQRIQEAQNSASGPACSLLEGTGDCLTCEIPLTASELKQVSIQHTGCATTIARVTCPTAPKF